MPFPGACAAAKAAPAGIISRVGVGAVSRIRGFWVAVGALACAVADASQPAMPVELVTAVTAVGKPKLGFFVAGNLSTAGRGAAFAGGASTLVLGLLVAGAAAAFLGKSLVDQSSIGDAEAVVGASVDAATGATATSEKFCNAANEFRH